MQNGMAQRVLIADDESSARDLWRAQLAELGLEVCAEASTGDDAVKLAEETQPDIALVDINMPGRTGLEVAKEISERANCPVVLLTGATNPDLISAAAESGVYGYLTKPVRLGDLGPMITLTMARFREFDSVRRRLETRTVLQRAKGILMDNFGLTEDEAHKKIHFAARSNNLPILKVATDVIETKNLPV